MASTLKYDKNGKPYYEYDDGLGNSTVAPNSVTAAGNNGTIGDLASSNPTIAQTIDAVSNQPVTQSGDPSIQDLINQYTDSLRKSRIASLDKARQDSLAALDQEKAGVEPQYYDKRNQAAAQSDVGAMNFAQYMAARGVKGNAGAMPEIYRNNALQGNIGALNRQEQATYDQIAQEVTGVESKYASDVAGANADIDAQGLQAYINQMNADRTYGLQLGEATGNINGTPTLAGQQFKQQTDAANKQNFIDTMGQYSGDYQAEINTLQNDGDPSNDWQIAYLKAARQNKISSLAATQASQGAAKYKQAMDMFQQLGYATPEIAAVLGIPVNTTTESYKKTQYDVGKPYYSTNDSSTSKNIENMGDSTQVQSYYAMLDSFSGGGNGTWKGNPQGAYQQLVSNRQAIEAQVGTKLYNQLLADVKSLTPYNKPDVPKSTDYKSDPDFIANIQNINNGTVTAKDIQDNATQLIQDYGYDGYQAMLNAAKAAGG